MEYFIIDNNGQQAGPFSLDQLAQKGITPETLVWAQGMTDWTPAWKVEELRNTLEAAEAIRDNASQQQAEQQNPPTTPQQKAFEQAQQAAYQQGFQQGAASMGQPMGATMGQRPDNGKRHGKTLWKLIAALLLIIILAFALTNPSEDAHKEKIRTEAGKAIEKATATADNNFFTQTLRSVAKMMADNVMGEAMDQLFDYHNYIVCSKGTVELNGKEHTVSFGILGKVYTMNADDMVRALEGSDLKIQESEQSSSPYGNIGGKPDANSSADTDAAGADQSDNADEATSQDGSQDGTDGDLGKRMQQKLEDKATQALDRAADKVGQKVKEKIKQKLNEATDSSTIDKIINKIESMM